MQALMRPLLLLRLLLPVSASYEPVV